MEVYSVHLFTRNLEIYNLNKPVLRYKLKFRVTHKGVDCVIIRNLFTCIKGLLHDKTGFFLS